MNLQFKLTFLKVLSCNMLWFPIEFKCICGNFEGFTLLLKAISLTEMISNWNNNKNFTDSKGQSITPHILDVRGNQTHHLLRTAGVGPRWTAAPGCCAWPPPCSSGIFIAWVMAFMTISPRGIRYIHWYGHNPMVYKIIVMKEWLRGGSTYNKNYGERG